MQKHESSVTAGGQKAYKAIIPIGLAILCNLFAVATMHVGSGTSYSWLGSAFYLTGPAFYIIYLALNPDRRQTGQIILLAMLVSAWILFQALK